MMTPPNIPGLITLALTLAAPSHAADPPTRPDPVLTPGEVATSNTNEFCYPGYSATARNTSAALKRRVYRSYGIKADGSYEIDHLVPLSLGGADTQRNLWPQSYNGTPWNAHVKDRLEARLLRLVCHGTLPAAEAQDAIARDWVAAYRRFCAGGLCAFRRKAS